MLYLLLALACLAPVSFGAVEEADLILHSGRILTVDSRFSIAQAVAVRAGVIVGVGDTRTVLSSWRGPRTRVVDLRGRTVLPGLIDAHVHTLSAGLSELIEPLPRLDSFAAIQSFIRAEARKLPKGEWIIVPRTFPTRLKEMSMPTREVLDAAAGHPVGFDASYVWSVNSLALQQSCITRDTPNPPGGEIVKDPSGEPNGILRNARQLLKGIRGRAGFSAEQRLAALEKILRLYLEAGLTSIGDRGVNSEDAGLFERLRAQNRLPVRVVLTWRLDAALPVPELERQIRDAPFAAGEGDDWLRWGTFKVTLDGGMTIGTAYQRQPYGPFGRQLYGQTDPASRGQLFITPDKLLSIFEAAHRKGWQMTAHTQGGGAIDAFLDAMETLNRDKPVAPSRSHLMHASFQSREAIQRAARLGVLADVQPQWLYLDAPALEKVFTYDGLRYFFPLRTYIDRGIIVAGGSDHMTGYDKNQATNPFNPFLGMWISVTRKTNRGTVVYPEERVTREEALKMYTIWAAHLQFAEKEKGSIETGKLADMVVVDRDYLTCPEEQIRSIEPLAVIIGGKIAVEKGSLSQPPGPNRGGNSEPLSQ